MDTPAIQKSGIEAQLERSHKELSDLRFALDQSAIVAITDQTGKINFVNDKFCEISKYSREELIGQDHRIINSGYHPKEFIRNLWTTIANGKVWRGEICNRAKDGSIYWVDTTIVPFLDKENKPFQYVAIRYEITERKLAEEKLRHSRENLSLAMKAARMYSWEIDIQRQKTSFGENYSQIFGMETPMPEMDVEETYRMMIHPEDAQAVRKFIDEATAGDGIQSKELRLSSPQNAEIVWIEASCYALRDDAGVATKLVGVSRNITERKVSEEQLRESEERMRLVLTASHIGIWIHDVINDRTYWSPETREIFGVREYDGKSETFRSFIHPDDVESVFKNFDKIIKNGGFFKTEFRIIRPDGKERWIESAGHCEYDASGKPMRFLGTNADITERKKSEERIRQQASLLEKAQDAIIVCDLNYQIIFWNKGAEKVYGFHRDEVLGKTIDQVMHDGDDTPLQNAHADLDKIGEWKGILEQLKSDKTRIFVESRWTLVKNDKGKPDYVLIINTDVTEQRKIEEQLLRAQRMESIGTLAGGIAHDLNNVLAPILMASEMLQLNELNEDSRRWLSIIAENVERGSNLVKQVLTFARGVEGERVSVHLKPLIKELVKVLRETFPKSINIKYDIDPDLWVVKADPTQIHQVLMNMAVNARDAMPNGGTLAFKAANKNIDEQYARLLPDANIGTHIEVAVSDTGVGIPSEISSRVFDPFFTTKEIGKGTGLGLSTSLSIVKSHGGFVNLYSEPGRGTRFSIYLPAVSVASGEAAATQKLPYPKGSGETILVVDDEENIRDVTKATLERFGYKVLVADDGTDALAVYAERKNDVALVLTDMAMPYMDGASTIRALRKLNPQIKVIAASGLRTNEQSAETANLDIQAFLTKPFTTEALLTTIDSVLKKS